MASKLYGATVSWHSQRYTLGCGALMVMQRTHRSQSAGTMSSAGLGAAISSGVARVQRSTDGTGIENLVIAARR